MTGPLRDLGYTAVGLGSQILLASDLVFTTMELVLGSSPLSGVEFADGSCGRSCNESLSAMQTLGLRGSLSLCGREKLQSSWKR